MLRYTSHQSKAKSQKSKMATPKTFRLSDFQLLTKATGRSV